MKLSSTVRLIVRHPRPTKLGALALALTVVPALASPPPPPSVPSDIAIAPQSYAGTESVARNEATLPAAEKSVDETITPTITSGSAPQPFADYLARQHFARAWKLLDANTADTRAPHRPDNPSIGMWSDEPKDGAHHPYTTLAGNYSTSQWQAPPWNKIGKLYFTFPNGTAGSCTASVISPNAIIVTAAHCTYTIGQGYHSAFRFVPAERNGVAPYGEYGWQQVFLHPCWAPGCAGGAGARRYDVALIRLSNELTTGLPVSHYVGSLGRASNYSYSQYMHSIAYSDFGDRRYTVICAGQTYDAPSEGSDVVVQGCNMIRSNGGSWLMNYTANSHSGNQVASVIVGPHNGASGTAHAGPRFNTDNIEYLCRRALC